MSFIGTLADAIEIVPTNILYIMASQNRESNYIFKATVYNNFVMVW